MVFRYAEKADIPQLVSLRVAYLKADWGELSPEQIAAVEKQVPGYLEDHLGQDFYGYVADDDGTIVGTVLMLDVEKPSSPAALCGHTGTLMNVYVNPNYRGQNIGGSLVRMALDHAKQLGMSHVDLQATAQGKKLYEYVGFEKSESHYTPMIYHL